MKIAFDVDGTLIKKSITGEDIPRYDVINMLLSFHRFGNDIFVWSGGGVDYATRWTEKLGIAKLVLVIPKGSDVVDMAIDDEDVELGIVNFKV